MSEHVSAEKLAEQVTAEFTTKYNELNQKSADMGEILDEIKKAVEGKADTTDLENRLKGVTEEVSVLTKAADDLDKRMARGGRAVGSEVKSFGEQVVGSDEFKSFVSEGGGRLRLDMKATLTSDLDIPNSPSYWGVPKEVAPMVTDPRRPLTMRDLIPVGRTNSNAIEFLKWTRTDTAAAPVAEGALKPETTIAKPTLTTVPIRTLAHMFYESKQLMDDSPAFQTIINQEMRRGLLEEEDDQVLNGDGTGQNLDGLLPNATAFEQSAAASGIPGGMAATQVDVIRWAKLQARQKFYPADTVVLNPEDWATIEMLKDGDNAYLYSAFTSGAPMRLWGLRVKECDSMPAGHFLVGGLSTAARIWDREKANVIISTENKDDFEKNMISIRAEERLALTVYRPDALVYGNFTVTA